MEVVSEIIICELTPPVRAVAVVVVVLGSPVATLVEAEVVDEIVPGPVDEDSELLVEIVETAVVEMVDVELVESVV